MKKKRIIAIVLALVLLVLGVKAVLYFAADKPVGGEKSVSIEVIYQDGTSTLYQVNTDAEYLLGAMQDTEGLNFEGEDSTYGVTIYNINGVVANYNENDAYWAFYVGDEYCAYGVSEQPVYDGDAFKIVYSPIP